LAVFLVLLGWRPSIALDDGLNKTIAYFEKLLSKEIVTA